ncbi:T150C-like protein [Mya arenaria]|uniref:T150C-like protein n=1 Tax=Mya arenaria TaxID=6604 RepID=A0ABY7E413_MYAAR|nr:T150C-like protein [Mya arenaria]
MSVPMLPIASEGDRFLENEEGIERYAIAVSYNHTEAFFPTIRRDTTCFSKDNHWFKTTHTAIEAPERCVFAQMVNIGAVLLGMTVILRYLFVKTFLLCRGTAGTDRSFCSNLAGLYLGIVSAFGLTIAANFQTKVQFVPHNIGAFSAFGFGTIYCWVQSAITYRCRCTFTGKRVLAALQFTNCIVMTLLFDTLRAVYLTSTITEWLLALSVLTFMFTFAPDFRKMRVDGIFEDGARDGAPPSVAVLAVSGAAVSGAVSCRSSWTGVSCRSSWTGVKTCSRSSPMDVDERSTCWWLSEWTMSPPSIYSKSSGRISVLSNE